MEKNADWTWGDYKTVYDKYPFTGPVPISDELNRTVNSVVGKAMKLGVEMPKEFSAAEKNIARSYGKQLGEAIMFLLPHRSNGEIKELLRCVEI